MATAEQKKRAGYQRAAGLLSGRRRGGSGSIEAAQGEATVYLSFEVAHLTTATEGLDEAIKLALQIRELNLEGVWPDETVLWHAAALKVRGGMGVGDAFIAGLAASTAATLIHQDPEFDKLQAKLSNCRWPET